MPWAEKVIKGGTSPHCFPVVVRIQFHEQSLMPKVKFRKDDSKSHIMVVLII